MKRLVFFLLVFSFLEAYPERYDHMSPFKRAHPPKDKIPPKKELVKDQKGNILVKALYFYNKRNQLVKIEYHEKEDLKGYALFFYSPCGLKEERTFSKKHILLEKIVYTCRKGKILSYRVLSPKGEEKLRWKFRYDSLGRLISGERWVDKDLTESFTHKYMGEKITQTLLYGAEKELLGEILYRYEKDRVIERVKREPIGIEKIRYFYDAKGRLIRLSFYRKEKGKLLLRKEHILVY